MTIIEVPPPNMFITPRYSKPFVPPVLAEPANQNNPVMDAALVVMTQLWPLLDIYSKAQKAIDLYAQTTRGLEKQPMQDVADALAMANASLANTLLMVRHIHTDFMEIYDAD